MTAFWIFLALAAIVVISSSNALASVLPVAGDFPTTDGDNVPEPTQAEPQGFITADPATWPSGDRIWNVCRAIGFAEGAHIQGSVPDRLNNPGDISDGKATFGFENHDGSDVTVFPSKETGWSWLYGKIRNISIGSSQSYSPDWTWAKIASVWAGNSTAWVLNVTNRLGVQPTDVFRSYFS